EPSDPLPAGAEEAGSADRVPHHFADVPRRHVQSGPVLRTLQGCLRRQVRRNLPGTGGPVAEHYQTAGTVPSLLSGCQEPAEEWRRSERWQILRAAAGGLPGVQAGSGAGRSDRALPVALHGEQLPQVGRQRQSAGRWQGGLSRVAEIAVNMNSIW
ncbi:AAEL015667-PA, partial [Aedes aegypti]